MVVYLIECRVWGKQYSGSTETMAIKAHIVFFGKNKHCQIKPGTSKSFHEHYLLNDHNKICDWQIAIIDHAETEKSLGQK